MKKFIKLIIDGVEFTTIGFYEKDKKHIFIKTEDPRLFGAFSDLMYERKQIDQIQFHDLDSYTIFSENYIIEKMSNKLIVLKQT
ncbi:hypothetical protein JOD45_000663 [Scopulibacillus daqui]|uniref:Uncharacterized protein n=1 Tax=Scopulibacillus daqui TaxID=1469162 RepID=A0ABS2PXN2_9BACL|nr:hypothetical protein [Scopulibacillus daqui]MBM7644470.1 hypothetical protein [Scopulibacillus daqui]